MKIKNLLVIGFVLFQVNNLFSQSTGLSTITQNDLLKTVKYLSSKELDGRMSGSEGYDKAARYMADEFRKLKLKPLGDNGTYFQNFLIEYNEINTCKLSLVRDNNVINNYRLGDEFVCRNFTGSGDFTAPVVFCGYGISIPGQNYDDYKGVDVKGKIALIFKQNPSWKLNNKDWATAYAREKAHTAAEHGAIGVLLVSLPNDKKPQKPIGSAMEGKTEQLENFPMMHIDLSIVGDFFEGSGHNIKELQSKIDTLKQPFSLNLNASAKIDVKAKYYKDKNTEDVIGLMEGTDPQLKNEYIFLTAHLDHVGSQAGQIYFPGANDNASGAATVLQLARAFAREPVKPKRSIIFSMQSCEESACENVKYFKDDFPSIYDNIIVQLAFDCIAFGDSLQIRNGEKAQTLWRLTKAQDMANAKIMVSETLSKNAADSAIAAEKGTQYLYFVTKNSYGHLHLLTDTPETLNMPLFENVSKLGYLTAFQAAQGNYKRPKPSNTDKK